MSKIEIILSVMLLLSVAINIGLFVYAKTVLMRLLNIADELYDLQQMTDNFAKHLNEVYELETFYGDQTLHSLLEHAVSFNEHIETFEHIYHLIEEEIEQEPDPTDASEPE
mgnify:FL=1